MLPHFVFKFNAIVFILLLLLLLLYVLVKLFTIFSWDQ